MHSEEISLTAPSHFAAVLQLLASKSWSEVRQFSSSSVLLITTRIIPPNAGVIPSCNVRFNLCKGNKMKCNMSGQGLAWSWNNSGISYYPTESTVLKCKQQVQSAGNFEIPYSGAVTIRSFTENRTLKMTSDKKTNQ